MVLPCIRCAALLALALCLSACVTARTPGGPAPQLAAAPDAPGTARRPAPQFPATLAVARLQAPDYRAGTLEGLGKGAFSLLPVVALPTDWPSVDSTVALERDLLPPKLESLDDLRLVAAKQQADVLLLYTLDTVFVTAEQPLPPATALPAKTATVAVRSTGIAVLVDVRSGYRFASVRFTNPNTAETITAASEPQRRAIEQATVDGLMAAAKARWQQVLVDFQ